MSVSVSVEIKGKIAWVTIDNPPVNATSTSVRAGLMDAVESVQGCDLAVLSCVGKTFVAGGDMSEFDRDPVPPHLPDVVNAIERSTTPFLALLHGTVLGGGFEIAMACAYRMAKPGTRFGLPEVIMGLIPGAGGTQRAPRLLGWNMAVEMACLAKQKTAEVLQQIGAIDLISASPEAEIGGFIGLEVTPVSKRVVSPMDGLAIWAAKTKCFAKGRQSPLHNLKALQWATEPYDIAQPRERALHLALRQSDESQALRHVFFAERSVVKPPALSGATPRILDQIAIVGGGLMGSGIAAACLNAGYRVTVIERDPTASAVTRQTVTSLMQGAVDRQKITAAQYEERLAALMTTDDYRTIADSDLAIEAVFEDLTAKRDVFRKLASVVRPDALLATNTSYLNPDDIFRKLPSRERCLGIHFFSPAHIMKLVEVVRAEDTSDETLATSYAFVKNLRKIPVLAGICDGFIGNRILAAYRRAAEYLLADGSLPHDVDAAMRAFGMAMGPFEAQDQVGMQIAEANRRRQAPMRPSSERDVPIFQRLCNLGRYGYRSGAGWYRYNEGSKSPKRDEVVETLITGYAEEAGIKRAAFTADDIQIRLLSIMANEGAQIVAEGIAESEAAVDVVKTAGYGFPRWRGGPMHWADKVGEAAVRHALDEMDAASPGSWIRAARFQE